MALDYRRTRVWTGPEHDATDPVSRWLAAVAGLISIVAFAYFSSAGVVLAYADSISHLEISRRIIDGTTPGFGQLGSVWLPLPHILMTPFISIDAFYYSGFAGSIVSMASYVITTVILYRTTFALTENKLSGIVTAFVYMANPNIIYMQSTPMTEVPLFACIAAMVYCTQRWIQTDRPKYLVQAGFAATLGTLTRYEAWIVLAAIVAVIVYSGWRKNYSYTRLEGTTLSFLYIGGLGIAGWLLWNMVMFGNPFNFQSGEYSKPSLWVDENEAAVGDWWIALQTYFYAVAENLWIPILMLAVVGVLLMGVLERFALRTLPVLSILGLFPFFVVALQQGQRPLDVIQVDGGLYNVRFGLPMILPAAIAIGYLVQVLSSRREAIRIGFITFCFACVGAFAIASLASNENIITLKEPASWAAQDNKMTSSEGISEYLRQNFDGGLVLMESFGNELVLFDARIPPRHLIYEGSYQIWEPALRYPEENNVEWLVMRYSGQTDKVHDALYKSDQIDQYELVYEDSYYRLYKGQ